MAEPLSPHTDIVAVDEPGAREHELHLQGKSWRTIATICGHTSRQAAFAARERYLQRAALELARDKRMAALDTEIERLNEIQAHHWEAATVGRVLPDTDPPERAAPDVRSADLILRLIMARAKLLGLDEPDQAVAGPTTVLVTGNSAQYVATLKKLAAGEIIEAELVDDD